MWSVISITEPGGMSGLQGAGGVGQDQLADAERRSASSAGRIAAARRARSSARGRPAPHGRAADPAGDQRAGMAGDAARRKAGQSA